MDDQKRRCSCTNAAGESAVNGKSSGRGKSAARQKTTKDSAVGEGWDIFEGCLTQHHHSQLQEGDSI